MSDLFEILDSHEDAIRRAFVENLAQSDCRIIGKTQAGSARTILRVLIEECRQESDTPGRKWANALEEEAATHQLTLSEVLSALNCLEQAARFQVVRIIDQKMALLVTLSELSDRVDALRQSYVASGSVSSSTVNPVVQDAAMLVEMLDEFVCLASLQGKPFYLNTAGRQWLALPETASVSSTNLHDFYSDDSWATLRDVAVPAVKARGRWEGTCQLRNQSTGELVEVMTTMFLAQRLHVEKRSFLAIIHRDGGDVARLRQTLAESESRKNAILESSLDPIITIDSRGVITEFNHAAEQTFGHPRQAVLGTQPSEVLFPPSKSADHRHRIDRYLDAGEGSLLGRRIEVEACRANGESFPAELAMTISQEQGEPVLSFFIRDIGTRKRAQEQQARYAAELERSNHELEQFAYVASHDLQEPLRKIRSFSDRLELRCGDSLDETGRECIQRMQSAAARMQVLIEGLLSLSRVTTQGQSFVKVDLVEIAQNVVADLEAQIERTEGRVDVGRLPPIQADPLQMRQLLQNLIGNALKFHRADEPPLVKVYGAYCRTTGAGQGAREPRGRTSRTEKCRIVVEDNGIGFDEKYVDRVFGVFQRLHPRDVYEGTGIGLAICRKIVERHDGTITVRSTPGKGAAFEIVLPVLHPKKSTLPRNRR